MLRSRSTIVWACCRVMSGHVSLNIILTCRHNGPGFQNAFALLHDFVFGHAATLPSPAERAIALPSSARPVPLC
jgi:hypothetical protein